ncbi:MAG: hypothetical protein D6773_05030 [Alphaproteobacteria bacterium]|nr:MAG: hypothetical protein D6773_05030 [Alphaproteobacteria bacterium]
MKTGQGGERRPEITRDGSTDEHILEEARKRSASALEFWSDVYKEADEDAAFADGNQWPDSVVRERESLGQSSLTINTLPQYIDQVLGDARRNSPSIKVSPADDAAEGQEVEGFSGERYTLAKVYEGLIRQIERDSSAEAHYDTAIAEAVIGGIGWLRVYSAYAAETTFDQVIRVKSVRGRSNVLLDPSAVEPDMSDANYGFVLTDLDRETFEKRYPRAQPGSLGGDPERDDVVRIAEYYSREPYDREAVLLSTGETVWRDEIKDVEDEMAAKGIVVVRSRKVRSHKVIWRKITANSVLEGPTVIPCSTIPLVPVFGKEIYYEGRPHYRGVIRPARDAKQVHNYWISAATDAVASSPVAPWLVTPAQIAGYEASWQDANRGNPAVLVYNSTQDGRPTREPPVPMPVAQIQMAREFSDLIKSTTGMYDASLGARSNETSGRAILARAEAADIQNFAYADNLARAIRRVGIIMVEMIPKIYDTERVIRIRREDTEGDWIRINQTVIDDETGEEVKIADMQVARMDVDVRSGPSYGTQRQEAVETMMELFRVVPQIGGAAVDILARHMDWPGADQLADRARKLLPKGLIEETDKSDAEGEQAQQGPTPEEQLAMAKIEAEMADAEATKAEAAARIAEAQRAAEMRDPEAIQQMVAEAVAEAMAAIMSNQETGQ